jgi:hypothetical protein
MVTDYRRRQRNSRLLGDDDENSATDIVDRAEEKEHDDRTLREHLFTQELDDIGDEIVPSEPIGTVLEAYDYEIDDPWFTELRNVSTDLEFMMSLSAINAEIDEDLWQELLDHGIYGGRIDNGFGLAVGGIEYDPKYIRNGRTYYKIPDDVREELRYTGDYDLYLIIKLTQDATNIFIKDSQNNVFQHYHGNNRTCLGGDAMGLGDITVRNLQIDDLKRIKNLVNGRLETINADSPLNSSPNNHLPQLSDVTNRIDDSWEEAPEQGRRWS